MSPEPSDPVTEFLVAALVPRHGPHTGGTIDRADAIRTAHPGVASASIYTAAVLGDGTGVRHFLSADPAVATAPGGPYGWDPLTHLCFSGYLKHEPTRDFESAARALLEAGANPNGGWFERDHQPEPVWESVLYGAAGIAHHPGLTRLLLEHGADPNDGETPYHAPETRDNRALQVLVESGTLTAENLAMVLLRKTDWHDLEGIRWLLGAGVDPNQFTVFGRSALHHAILRDNDLEILVALLDAGADPALPAHGRSATALAARRGRKDFLAELDRRGVSLGLAGVDALVACCARADRDGAAALLEQSPLLLGQLLASGGELLAAFAGNDHPQGLELLLDLGVPVGASHHPEDGYWGYARGSTALHVAAWRLSHDTVRFLVERGADVHARDARGQTPLMLAVRGCVDSYWSEWKSAASVEALLAAGASVDGVMHPSGYDEVDRLITAQRS